MKQDDIVIKSDLRYFRNQAGITQKQLADEVGCSLYMIQLMEANKCIPNLKLAYAIAMTIGDHIDYRILPTLIFKNLSLYYSNN